MPQAFTPQQMEDIRARLFDSACRHAVGMDVKRISLERLTSDAGISKSTFYKFYDSKEELFLQVGMHFEMLIVGEAERVLRQSAGSSRERTANAVNAAFDRLAELNVMRFLKEDMPQLVALGRLRGGAGAFQEHVHAHSGAAQAGGDHLPRIR